MDEKNNPTTQEPEVPATATNTAAVTLRAMLRWHLKP